MAIKSETISSKWGERIDKLEQKVKELEERLDKVPTFRVDKDAHTIEIGLGD